MMIVRRILFLLVLLACASPSRADDPFGTIEGRVVDGKNRPIGYANVIVVGTRRGAQADEHGRFMVTIVPTGRQFVRVLVDGMEAVMESLDVVPGKNPPRTIVMRNSVSVERGETFITGPRRVVSRGDLVAEIVPVRSPIKIYETPSFRVRIYNRSARPIVLVICNDGSQGGGSPRGTFKISAPFDAFAAPPRGPIAFCGTGRYDVYPRDFIEVQPGEYFEPFDTDVVTPRFDGAVPTRPGHYGVTFRYSTSESDVSRWTRRNATPEVLDLLARVPVVDLEAKATFKVDY